MVTMTKANLPIGNPELVGSIFDFNTNCLGHNYCI